MFIENGKPVDVIAGRMAGRFGVVSKIRIVPETFAVLVFVDVFEPETGGTAIHLFQPHELKRRRFSEADELAFIGLQTDRVAEVIPLPQAA